ncbi:hypothetical protein L0P70_01725 [Faecalibacterium prausnitzii]|jgi:hypothetical protein|uniref:Uncharacterized protein n=1 Tax=Faecalibacterium prausnitzii TaxID=853 RepID=A0A844DIL6_9FIRM|nr:hypothetical protein [Faecalibacterium prausnitzii]MBV0927116.1 hypothetical protein [Faecalibacterium prausnitzii]MCG4794264.1 hypothetical protein [Faecalibacterium prausnitzii]MCG4799428.1 hypothetical protein [Faecalibacterium prausnitzii]MDE8724234.1 hypothetical protein [Faecalibacterium prausnitzii]MEE0242151.1 hypothetical protein [Faecalibacterium prausnitzii]
MARLLGDFIVVQKNLVSKGIDKMSCFLQKSENAAVHIQQAYLGDIVDYAEKRSQKNSSLN